MKPLIISGKAGNSHLFATENHVNTILLTLLLTFFLAVNVSAQKRTYNTSNAHSHNDYLQPLPFLEAYDAAFGSIEADIFLRDNKLFVAHDTAHITAERTLQALYLDPLARVISNNKGAVYKDRHKALLLLIDIKTTAEPTLARLVAVLNAYKAITKCSTLKIVVTGNQPAVSQLISYPSYLYFDGKPEITYTDNELKKVSLFSDNFARYSKWKGEGTLPDSVKVKILATVQKAHNLNRPIRFWGAPDNPDTWLQLMQLNVDYLNTDKIKEMAAFLKSPPKS